MQNVNGVPPRNNLLRILIVDDHEAVREGVRAVLTTRNDIEVCGEAANGQEAIEKARLATSMRRVAR
jgi:DNA-binding NarL/FixJ family response regulator